MDHGDHLYSYKAWSVLLISHQVGSDLSSSLVTKTIKDALKREVVLYGLILHSDQGQQYRSDSYFALAKDCGITASMSRRGNCLDNASIESFFGQLKTEGLRRVKPEDIEDAAHLINEYIHFYNYQMIQLKPKRKPYEKGASLSN